MAKLFATVLFVLSMVFRQGSSLQCYQCASSLFPECLDESEVGIYAGECDGGLTLCSVIATTITLAGGEEIHETSRQCAVAHSEGCVVVEAEGQTTETCTQTCDTDTATLGPVRLFPQLRRPLLPLNQHPLQHQPLKLQHPLSPKRRQSSPIPDLLEPLQSTCLSSSSL